MMSGDQLRSFIGQNFGTESAQYQKPGTANTNWQKVLRTTFATTTACR